MWRPDGGRLLLRQIVRDLVIRELRDTRHDELASRIETDEVGRGPSGDLDEYPVLPQCKEQQQQQFRVEQHDAPRDDAIAHEPVGLPELSNQAGDPEITKCHAASMTRRVF